MDNDTFRDSAYPEDLDAAIETVLESEKLLIVELIDRDSQHYQALLPSYACTDPGPCESDIPPTRE